MPLTKMKDTLEMKKPTILLLLFSLAAIAGCATEKDWEVSGGSRADGTVKLSYEYRLLQKPEANTYQGDDLATTKCQSWGYSGARAFGKPVEQCKDRSSDGSCISWVVTAYYECLGDRK